MEPTLQDGDRLLIDHSATIEPGDLVVARFADGTVAVKRAVETRATIVGRPGWWLLSDNLDEGVDSRHRGAVAVDDCIAVVRARVWPVPRLGRHLVDR